jgi:hypothetical protein
MPRDISTPMVAPLLSNAIRPIFMAAITFATSTIYAWSGVGNLIYGGNTYTGVGNFGKFSPIVEGTDVQAYGATISLSAIDPLLFTSCQTEIQQGAPVTISFGLLDAGGSIIGVPYPLFVGTVDQPKFRVGTQEMTITLSLESKLANLQRANQRRYTDADQRLYYPGDSFCGFVSQLADQALLWLP